LLGVMPLIDLKILLKLDKLLNPQVYAILVICNPSSAIRRHASLIRTSFTNCTKVFCVRVLKYRQNECFDILDIFATWSKVISLLKLLNTYLNIRSIFSLSTGLYRCV